MKILLAYHLCHKFLCQTGPTKPAAPTSFWAKFGKIRKKNEKIFRQNVHVFKFGAKAKFFSQNRALIGRRHITQEYSVKISCQNLQRFSLSPLNKWYHCINFSLVQRGKFIHGAGFTPLSSSSTTVRVSNAYLTGLSPSSENLLQDRLIGNTHHITHFPGKL
jgi:hypothetical protein